MSKKRIGRRERGARRRRKRTVHRWATAGDPAGWQTVKLGKRKTGKFTRKGFPF